MAKKSKQASKPKQDDGETLATVVKDFNSAWEYTQGSWHKRWEDNYRLYNNERVNRGYEGITDTFVPMTFSTVETLTSALFGTKPKFAYLPPSDKPDQKTDILNGLIDFYWDKDQWSIKVINTGRTGLMLGTGIDFFYWYDNHVCMLNIPLRDYFRDPVTPGMVEPRFQGRRFLETKENLESFEILDLNGKPDDEGNLPMKKKYKNLNLVTADAGATGDPLDKEEKDMWYGTTVQEPEKHQIEIIEYWTEDKVISIANRSVVIQDDENPFKTKARENGDEYAKGLVPFNWFRDYVDPSLFYAKGEVDFIADQQELLNDNTNQRTDAITFNLNQMYTLDPAYAHLINEIENLPGAIYPVPAGTLNPIPVQSIPPDSFNESQNTKNEIRETTGSNEVVRGVKSDANATATEINAQIAGAGQRISLKVTQIENEYFHRMAKIVLALIKLYVTEPMMVRILGKDGAKWEEFDPEEFKGDYEPKVQLDISVENKKQQKAEMAKEMLAAFLNDPEIDQAELKKKVLADSFDLEPDEVELLVKPMNPMGIDPAMGGLPAEGMPPPTPEELAMLEAEMAPPEEQIVEPTDEELLALQEELLVEEELA